METMLVTGGAGFIGSNFVRHALGATSDRVVVLDKLTYAGSLESLADVSNDPRFAFVLGDIADRETVGRVFREHAPASVLNFAAESHVDRSIEGPRPFVQTNVVGTFELLEASRTHVASLGDEARARFRFLHVSTDEVYGSLGATGLFHEETPYAPNSPYAASKASADHLVRAYHETFGLGTIITNCSNNYGPYQFPEKLVPLMILNALEGKPLPIYGDGGNVRDWLYVLDHCAGILLALRDGKPAAYLRFQPDSHDACTVIRDPATVSITGAYTVEEARGGGIGRALLNAGLAWARERGYARCAVDFEAMNTLGSAFWLQHFRPVVFSLRRHISSPAAGRQVSRQ